MKPFQDIVDRLADWAAGLDLIQKAEEGCEACFRNEGGEIHGWTAVDLRKEFRSHRLCFQSNRVPYNYVTTRLDLYASDGYEMGYYEIITLLDGEIIDDTLVLDDDKQTYLSTRKP